VNIPNTAIYKRFQDSGGRWVTFTEDGRDYGDHFSGYDDDDCLPRFCPRCGCPIDHHKDD
jgi:hypothetical protein